MSDSLAVMLIPEKNDIVWDISSEKVPHMTLLYFPKPARELEEERIVKYIEEVAASYKTPLVLEVQNRGVLGDDLADVVFLKGHSLDTVNSIRLDLLSDVGIRVLYNSVKQFPVFTPHLTLGYPKTPAKNSLPILHGQQITFDSCAVFSPDEGPTFKLGREGLM